MEENFDEIVRNHYNRLCGPFKQILTRKYPSMRLSTAEDLFQEAFLAVHHNIMQGRVRPNTDWNSYIIKIGLNLASKDIRNDSVTDNISSNESVAMKVKAKINELSDQGLPLFRDPEVLSRLGNELEHTPEPCSTIIRLSYYTELSMAEIAEKVGMKNANTVKAKKSQCMKDLIDRVTVALRMAGYDVSPKRRIRNGKN